MVSIQFVTGLFKDFPSKKESCGVDDASFNWDSTSYYRGDSFAFLNNDPFASSPVQVVPTYSTASTARTAVNSIRSRSSQNSKAIHPKKRRWLRPTTFVAPSVPSTPCLPPTEITLDRISSNTEVNTPIEIFVTVEVLVSTDEPVSTRAPSSNPPAQQPQQVTVDDIKPASNEIAGIVAAVLEYQNIQQATEKPKQSARRPLVGFLSGASIKSLIASCKSSIKLKVSPDPVQPLGRQGRVRPAKKTKKAFALPAMPKIRFRRSPKLRPNPFANMPYPIQFFDPGPHQNNMYAY